MPRPALLRDPTAAARIELVTFDLDDCLWDSAEVMQRAEDSRQAALAEHYPRIADRWSWRAFRTEVMAGLAETRLEIAHSPSELQKEGLRWCATQEGYDDQEAVADLGFGAFAAARLRPVMFPGALELLRDLRAAGYTVGTLSNGNADVTSIAELRDCVDFSLTAEGVGAAKPDSAMFHAAMAAAGVSIVDTLPISDQVATFSAQPTQTAPALGAKTAPKRSLIPRDISERLLVSAGDGPGWVCARWG